MGCPDLHAAMHNLRLQRLPWIDCPGHAGVMGSERANTLASVVGVTTILRLVEVKLLRDLRNLLNTDRPEHYRQ